MGRSISIRNAPLAWLRTNPNPIASAGFGSKLAEGASGGFSDGFSPAAAASPTDAAALAQWREDSLRGCIGGARERVSDPNVPVERHCACAVDREMAGQSYAELEEEERAGAHERLFPAMLRQCIAEISPGYRPGRR